MQLSVMSGSGADWDMLQEQAEQQQGNDNARLRWQRLAHQTLLRRLQSGNADHGSQTAAGLASGLIALQLAD